MPLRELHRQVAAVALRAAGRHGFVLGGGNALIAHGVISRPTADVDLVTNMETGVRAAAGLVEAALRADGFGIVRADSVSDLADVFEGLGDELAEWHVTAPGGQATELQMAYFARVHEPVAMDGVGPVLGLEDLAGSKVCALVSRAYERDYADTAALLGQWTAAELIGFARRLDPGLDPRDLAAVAARLDRMPDAAFAPLGFSGDDVAMIRERFASWPQQQPHQETGRPQ